MKKTNRLLQRFLLAGSFIACLIFFSACHTSSFIKDTKTKKKIVNLEIAFKKGTSDEEITKGLVAIQKIFLDSIATNNQGLIVLSVKFSFERMDNGDNGPLIKMKASITYDKATLHIIYTVRPPAPPWPHYEWLLDFKIIYVRDFNVKEIGQGQFNNGK